MLARGRFLEYLEFFLSLFTINGMCRLYSLVLVFLIKSNLFCTEIHGTVCVRSKVIMVSEIVRVRCDSVSIDS